MTTVRSCILETTYDVSVVALSTMNYDETLTIKSGYCNDQKVSLTQNLVESIISHCVCTFMT